MGWKKVKEHYDIKHIVQVDSRRSYGNEPCIFIGSPYISDLIVIRMSDGHIIKRYTDGIVNKLLEELQPKLDKDEKNGFLKQLIDEQDTFERLLPVYEIQNRKIVKTWCEDYGYPNVTTDGKLMYENTFTSELSVARRDLLKGTKVNWLFLWRRVKERFSVIGRQIKLFRYELGEVWDCIYVRCWGRFFVHDAELVKVKEKKS